ncbi:response regulator [Chitinimonas arctica]|uniref:response regulator n=1 Tax=Chitinimonas arctica TaxID=2594795 RepID=UPI0015D25072|nr:response regulator [Chitinimonas arctica]
MARVLVIEDNPDNLELMTYLLKAFGYSVLTAVDGEAGIARIAQEKPDLVVCDIHLPKADGYEVARRTKADPSLAGIPMVAVTALAMVGDRDRVLAAGFDGYLTKPIDPQTFIGDLEGYFLQPCAQVATVAWTENVVAEQLPRCDAKVLLVDDLPVNRELLRSILEPLGYRLRMAADAHEAYALACQEKPDLILSDLLMPRQDGLAFIRQVKGDPGLADVPFVLLSSSDWGVKDRHAALELGAARFIQRPIEPRHLLDEIAACLQSAKESKHGHHTDR